MVLMEINTIIGCRVKCDFCPQDLLIKEYSSINNKTNINYGSPDIMTFETFKTCLIKIPKSVLISFSGFAEPFLNPECSKMIVYAFNLGYTIDVFSTLVGLTLKDIDEIKHIPFKLFHVHLPDEEMYAKIAVNSNYLEVFEHLLASNISHLTAMTMGTVHPKIKPLLKSNILADKMINRAGNLKSIDTEFKRKTGPLVCNQASRATLIDRLDQNVLLPNGDVTLCCMDYGLKNIMGNLVESSYQSLFQNENFKNIRKKMKSDNDEIICRSCPDAIFETDFNEQVNLFTQDHSNDPTSLSIIQLYQTLLHRYPDKAGFDFFYSKMSSNELNLKDIETNIKQSTEYKLLPVL